MMSVSIESKGGFEKALAWLDRVSSAKPITSANAIAKAGEQALKNGTPKDTGATANGWRSDVKMNANGLEISWKNVAHPGESVNIAKLIELGHGTRTGGYVQPQPYIKQSVRPVLDSGGDRIVKEMIK